jgi:hypothetical protein
MDDMAKEMGFRNYSEMSSKVSFCVNLMSRGSPITLGTNCSLSDYDCMLKETGEQMKRFNQHFAKVLASSVWKSNRCETWMLGGGGGDDPDDKIEDLEDRIEELESEIDSLRN